MNSGFWALSLEEQGKLQGNGEAILGKNRFHLQVMQQRSILLAFFARRN
jgi:hypothetical protein